MRGKSLVGTRPLAQGSWLKGLYPPDVRLLCPPAADLPGTLVLTQAPVLDKPQMQVQAVYQSKDKMEQYEVRIVVISYLEPFLFADGPLQLAHAEFLKMVTTEVTDNGGQAKPLNLPGTDEANQLLRPYTNQIYFRVANVLFRVNGWAPGDKPNAPLRTEAVAKAVLARVVR